LGSNASQRTESAARVRALARQRTRQLRQLILRVARARGLEPRLRQAERILGTRAARRNLRDDEHFRLLCAFVLRADSNCIDVGANRGSILRHMVEFAPNGHHIAYEPLPELADELGREFPTVEVRGAALSNHSGVESFARVRHLPSRSGLHPLYHSSDEVETVAVRVEPLDESLPEGYAPALIKIDVEGAEQQVLEGALQTIALHKPVVVFEHQSSAGFYGTQPGDIHELLCERAGLRIFDMDGAGPYGVERFEQAVRSGARQNFLAHH
jgi:FkbM family methyltransferase